MNANRNERREASAVAAATATMDTDARVVRALDELRSAIDGGENVDREMLLAKYHDIAEPLGKCLDALEVVDGMAPQMAAAVDSERSDMLWLSDDHHIPARFGDYRLVRQIGGGGMGIVFEAEQVSLGRRVALKVLPFAAMLDQKCCQRFHNEARAAATLDHPNIVAVFAVGLERGVHYYAMQLISGQSMDRLIAELRLIGRAESNRGGCSNTFGSTNTTALKTPVAVTGDAKRPPDADLLSGQGNCGQANDSCPVDGMPRRLGITSETDLHSPRFFRQVARWGIEAAKAVDHAHENGVVHRDIKPGNLLVDTSGKLWVTDFGLARLERDNGLTMTGDLIGTARYMSPEQAHGGHAVIDHRTDIYSLGVTLHEMLTLQPAFAARDRQALLRQIATVDPRPLRRIKKSVPADLETIVLKATNKEPRARYASAQAVADDLQRFLDNEPIQARPPSQTVKLTKWLRRHMAVVMTALVTVTLALSVSTVLIGRAWRNEREQRTIAERQRIAAQENFRLAQGAVDNLYINLATKWLASETAPSQLQQQFLSEASNVYERLAEQPHNDAGSLHYAGVAYERIGDIRQYSDEGRGASMAYDKAINIAERLVDAEPDNPVRQRELAERYRKLGVLLDGQSRADEPIKALERACGLVDRAFERLPEENELGLERADCRLSLARALMRSLRFDEADEMLAEADEILTQSSSDRRGSLEYSVCLATRDLIRTQLLRHQGRLEEAEEYGQKAHDMWKFEIRFLFRDVRELLHLETALLEELAHISVDAGRYPEAVTRYHELLDCKQSSFKAGMEPVMVEFRGFLQQLNLDENHEPRPFCDYVETQMHLARVLQKVGRPYEAESVLGQCERVCQLLAEGEPEPRALRYLVAWANCWSEVGVLLAESRPSDSELAFRRAAAIWRHTRPRFPQAKYYRSGVRGLQADWDWFSSNYSQYLEASRALKFGSDGQNLIHDTVFYRHASGRIFSQAEVWGAAIAEFQKSARLREDKQPYDWYQIAIANWHLVKADEARQWYDRAATATEQRHNDDAELEELRQQTAELLEIEETYPTAPLSEGLRPQNTNE